MEHRELEQLIRQVAEEVLRRQSGAPAVSGGDGERTILVIGALDAVPERLRAGAALRPLAEYEAGRDILRYDAVVVTELTLLQLVDASLGRPGDAACCAIVSALLEGREVDLLESALPHRAYEGRSSSGLYAHLEGYVRALQGYGVKLWTAERLKSYEEEPAKPAKFAPAVQAVPTGSARPNAALVVTEDAARKLAADAQGVVTLPRGAIVTPSARDVFLHAGVTLKTEK